MGEMEASGFRKLTEKGQHEDAVVPYPQLVHVLKVVSGHKVLVLEETRRQKEKSEGNQRQPGSFRHGNTEEMLSRASRRRLKPNLVTSQNRARDLMRRPQKEETKRWKAAETQLH